MESCEEINCQAAHQASAHRRVLLITTVDIGGGVFEQIEIMEEDDPLDVTMQFCEDHSLPGSVLELLTEHILQTLQDTEMPPSPGWVGHIVCIASNVFLTFRLASSQHKLDDVAGSAESGTSGAPLIKLISQCKSKTKHRHCVFAWILKGLFCIRCQDNTQTTYLICWESKRRFKNQES